jgi:lipid A 4'-phosphatase
MNDVHGDKPLQATQMARPAEVALLAKTGLAIAVAAAILFTLMPGADIAVSRLFADANDQFLLATSPVWRAIRWLLLRGATVWYVVLAVACVLSAAGRRPVLGLSSPKWWFMGACAIAGPLLLTNVLLKEGWGRWRPREIGEFGGSGSFTLPLDPTGSCADNCSFVSGEVSSAVMIFLAMALVSGPWRFRFYWLAAVAGVLTALIRVGQGGHFLSDTLFAAAFMMMTASAIYALMFFGAKPLADEDHVYPDRLAHLPDAFFGRICSLGLALLDRVAPRR